MTKIIGGHGNSIGGIIIEKGDFDWSAGGKFPTIVGPDPSYHGVDFWAAFGKHDQAVVPGLAYVLKIRCGLLRDTGACLSPTNSFLIMQGIETLHLRAKQHCANAQAVAEFFAGHEAVEWVEYAGLPDHPDHARAQSDFPIGPGAVFGFGVKGGYEAGKKVIDAVELCSHLANILDAKTLIIHPSSTTHQQLTPEEQISAGLKPEMIRLSIGIEDVADIIADLDQALKASRGAPGLSQSNGSENNDGHGLRLLFWSPISCYIFCFYMIHKKIHPQQSLRYFLSSNDDMKSRRPNINRQNR